MAIRTRSIGELLDGAFRLYRQDLGLYLFTAIVAALPMVLFMVLTVLAAESETLAVVSLVFLPLAMIASIVVWAALMHQMDERLQGRVPSLGPSVKRALKVCLRVVWGAVLAYLAIVFAMFAGVLVAVLAGTGAAMVLPESASLIVLGVASVAIFLTLGLWVIAGVTLFLPGIIVENRTAYQALKRGFELARGGRMRVVSVLFLAWVLILVPMMAVYFVTGTASMLVDPEAATSGTIGIGQLVVQQVLVLLSSGFTTPFLVACVLLVYYDQRVRLEAYDLEAEADALAG